MRKPLLTMLLAGLLLAGCTGQDWQTKDISGLMPELRFELVEESGREVTAEEYRGRVTLLFFGFTHCPDVCPTTLARLAAAFEALRERGQKAPRVLFVTVDPARDDLEALRQYTDAFGESFIGLRGDRDALDALTRRYRVTYGYGEKDETGNYPVSHSSGVFAFDRNGQARLLMRESDSLEAITADLRRLISRG